MASKIRKQDGKGGLSGPTAMLPKGMSQCNCTYYQYYSKQDGSGDVASLGETVGAY